MDSLFLLFNGEVCVEKDGLEVGVIRDGSMIGEISFIRGGEATATVLVTNVCRVINWSSTDLQNLLTRNPSMDIGMKHVFSMDLTRKLMDA
jgi:CRP-like cAMP-binding protein